MLCQPDDAVPGLRKRHPGRAAFLGVRELPSGVVFCEPGDNASAAGRINGTQCVERLNVEVGAWSMEKALLRLLHDNVALNGNSSVDQDLLGTFVGDCPGVGAFCEGNWSSCAAGLPRQ